MKTQLVLRRAEGQLVEKLEALQNRVQAGEEGAWQELLQVTATLVAVHQALSPERGGSLLTTAEMAARMGIAPKTLLKHKAAGRIRPATEHGGGRGRGGKLLRWSGQERLQ